MNCDEARNAARYAGAKAEAYLDICELAEAKTKYEEAIDAIESVEGANDE